MNIIFDNTNTVGSLPKHDYVDLGLPSGTLWATENIKDANGNELYFAWGETCGYIAKHVKEGKFNWDDETNYGIKKYNRTDGLTILEPQDDASTINWGKEWKTPTKEQFEEVMAYTKYEWVEIDGVSGGKFTSTVEGYTDKFVFFPAVGYADEGEVNYTGYNGEYWSASRNMMECGYAWYFYFIKSFHERSQNGIRYVGCSVRPVHV